MHKSQAACSTICYLSGDPFKSWTGSLLINFGGLAGTGASSLCWLCILGVGKVIHALQNNDFHIHTNVSRRLPILIPAYNHWIGGGTRGVIVIVVENEHGDTCSNSGRDWLPFT